MTWSDNEFLQTAEAAARRAGDVLKQWSQKFTVREKNPADLVTEADFESQRTIYDFMHERFPEHNFLGEEHLEVQRTDSEFCWIVDPLDGTSNYVHGFPFFCVSIGLEHRGELVAGVIFDPTRDELFAAVRGGGASVNGRALSTTAVSELRQALVVASLPVAAAADHPAVQQFLRVLPRAQHIQRTGSSALNLAYVASGRIDAYWSQSSKPWDVAAGALLVREAGGRVTRRDGRPFDIHVPDLLASNGTSLHDELQTLLSD